MATNIKKSTILFLKTITITVIFACFLFLMFFVLNEGQKNTNGNALSVRLTPRSINIENGDRLWRIEPNLEKTSQFLNFIYSNSQILPAPYCFKDMAEFVVDGLF